MVNRGEGRGVEDKRTSLVTPDHQPTTTSLQNVRPLPLCRARRVRAFPRKTKNGRLSNDYSITGLRPTDTPENPYGYTFTVRCTDCGEHHPNDVSFTRFVSTPGSPRSAIPTR